MTFSVKTVIVVFFLFITTLQVKSQTPNTCFEIESMKKANKPIKKIYKMLEAYDLGKTYSKYLIYNYPKFYDGKGYDYYKTNPPEKIRVQKKQKLKIFTKFVQGGSVNPK